MIRYSLLVLLLLPNFARAESHHTVHWLYSEMPPAHIVKGEYGGEGYADLTLQLLIEALPEYEHVKLEANYKRSLNEMSIHHDRCHTALLKTPDRKKDVIFSDPVYLLAANKLFVDSKNVEKISHYLNKHRKVDLERLLAEESFILGVSSGAKYGEAIDGILQLTSSRDNLVYRSAIDHYSGLSAMLTKKQRLDGFLGLPVENVFFRNPNQKLRRELTSFYVKGSDEYLVGYIGCSNSAYGKKLIEKINKVVLVERTKKIKDFYQRWLLPKDKVVHDALLKKAF